MLAPCSPPSPPRPRGSSRTDPRFPVKESFSRHQPVYQGSSKRKHGALTYLKVPGRWRPESTWDRNVTLRPSIESSVLISQRKLLMGQVWRSSWKRGKMANQDSSHPVLHCSPVTQHLLSSPGPATLSSWEGSDSLLPATVTVTVTVAVPGYNPRDCRRHIAEMHHPLPQYPNALFPGACKQDQLSSHGCVTSHVTADLKIR